MSASVASRFLKPEVLARLGSLELVARTVVDGVLTGMHRSPHFGFSQEFAEYRAYNEGDDLRFVDWNVYARTDRAYIKRFQGETNTAVMLLLDASASMNFGSPVTKFDQARWLVASLAYLTRKQHDALGVVVFDDAIREFQEASGRPDSLARTLTLLEKSEPGQGTDLVQSLTTLRAGLSRRGLVILVSDLYADPDELADALQPLSHAGHDLAVFHVLDEEEVEPSLQRISALRDLESDESVVVDPEFLRTGYRTRFAQHRAAMESTCARLGADYLSVMSNEALDTALQAYLRFRERRAR